MLASIVGILLAEVALLGSLSVAYRRRNTAAVINTLAAIGLTLVPPVVDWLVEIGSVRWLTFAVAVAGFLHSLGMLGLYESVGWWDHLTHTLSAGIVAALLYAGLLTRLGGSEGVPAAVVVGTVLGTFAVGVGWELLELLAREVADRYDIEPVLVHYGRRDTALDLVFDLVGALLVVALDVRVFVPVVEAVLRATGLT